MAMNNMYLKITAAVVILGIPLSLFAAVVYQSISPREYITGMLVWFVALIGLSVAGTLTAKRRASEATQPVIPPNENTRRRIQRGIRRRKVWIVFLAIVLPLGTADGIAHRAWIPTSIGVAINLMMIYVLAQDIGERRRQIDQVPQ